MPRRINLLAVAAGKLVLAIEKELGGAMSSPGLSSQHEVMSRAKTLQHAAHNKCVAALLNERSVAEYLDVAWVELHPAVIPSIESFSSELAEFERL